MSYTSALSRQLGNSIDVIHRAISSADDDTWTYGSPPFFQIVFHTIYALDQYFGNFDPQYTNVLEQYMLPDPLQQYADLGFFDKELDQYDRPEKILTRDALLKYLDDTRTRIRGYFAGDIASQFSDPAGFSWLNFDKFELIIHNIWHIMGHSGVLNEYLKANNRDITGWVGKSEL